MQRLSKWRERVIKPNSPDEVILNRLERRVRKIEARERE